MLIFTGEDRFLAGCRQSNRPGLPKRLTFGFLLKEEALNPSPQPINLFDFEDIAKERLPKEEYDYIAGGATDEISVDRNRRAYESWALRPRVLRNVSTLDLSTTVIGTKVNLPVLIATCGGHKRAH